MAPLPASIRLARALLLLFAALWMTIGVLSLAWLASGPYAPTPLIVALLMFGGAAISAFLAAGLGRWRWVYPATLLWLVSNIVLTIADDFGAADLLYLLFCLLVLGVLIAGRFHFGRTGN